MAKTIGKKTKNLTKEQKAKRIYSDFTLEQREELFSLMGKIACGEVKNFYSTRIYKKLTKDFDSNQRALVSYMCQRVTVVKVFDDMDKLVLIEE